MTKRNKTEQVAHEHYHPYKPIRYWQASNGDINNSIALLRHKYKYDKSITFRAIR